MTERVEEYVCELVKESLTAFATEMFDLDDSQRIVSIHRERHVLLVTLGDGSAVILRAQALRDPHRD